MKTSLLSTAALVMLMAAMPASAADIRIGLQDDPDTLDPHQSRAFVARIVYTGLCDKLVDVSQDVEIVPQLATSWEYREDGKVLVTPDGATLYTDARYTITSSS